MSCDAVLKCGSNLAMSPAWAVTSSFFRVVWAWAVLGSAGGSPPSTPSAAAPLISSRRVTFMDTPPLERFGSNRGLRQRCVAKGIAPSPGPVKRVAQHFAEIYRKAPCRDVPARRHLRRQDLEGREACRPSRRAADEVRAGHHLKTAKALSLTIPQTLLLRADQSS